MWFRKFEGTFVVGCSVLILEFLDRENPSRYFWQGKGPMNPFGTTWRIFEFNIWLEIRKLLILLLLFPAWPTLFIHAIYCIKMLAKHILICKNETRLTLWLCIKKHCILELPWPFWSHHEFHAVWKWLLPSSCKAVLSIHSSNERCCVIAFNSNKRYSRK